jgi:hypothetical protein
MRMREHHRRERSLRSFRIRVQMIMAYEARLMKVKNEGDDVYDLIAISL